MALQSVLALNVDPEQAEPFLSSPTSVKEGPTWTPLLIITAIATTLGTTFPAGYNMGILNAPQNIITVFCNESVFNSYGTVMEETPLNLLWSFVVSIFLIGGCFGALLGGPIANKIGRKNGLLFNLSLNLIAAVVFGTCTMAQSVEMLLIGRLIVGFAAGMSTSFMPLYMSEIGTPQTASILGILCPFGIVSGLFLGQILSMEIVLGTEEHWNILLAITAVPALISAALWWFIPESPRYLFVLTHNGEAGIKELCRLRQKSVKELDDEIELLRREITEMVKLGSADESIGWSIGSIWAAKELRTRFICVLVLHVVNQLTGINAVIFYSTSIFQSAGLSKEQAEFTLLGVGSVNMVMGALGAVLISRFRRRILLFTSMGGVCVFLIVQTITILYIDEASWLAYVCIVALITYIIFFGLGCANLPFFLPTELIPAGPRPLVMSVGCMVNWILNFSVGMCFPMIQAAIGIYSFTIFTAVTGALLALLVYILPETKPL